MSLFSLRGLTRDFGGLVAVDHLSLEVAEGSITSLIGPNGAGKTTVFNVITGLYEPSAGEILFAGRSIGGLKPHQVSAAGISRTFQNIRLFATMSALENVLVGHHARMRATFFGSIFRTGPERREEAQAETMARELLDFVGLDDRREDLARNLPYGQQRRLEIARALASQPRLLLLDEPAAGTNPQEKQQLSGLIERVRQRGVTVFLIEHDMRLVMGISEHIVVVDHGEKIAEGTPEVVRADPAVIEAYLGKSA